MYQGKSDQTTENVNTRKPEKIGAGQEIKKDCTTRDSHVKSRAWGNENSCAKLASPENFSLIDPIAFQTGMAQGTKQNEIMPQKAKGKQAS